MRRFFLLFALVIGCGPKAEDVPVLRSDHCPVGGCKDAAPPQDAGPIDIPDEPLEPWDTTGEGALSGIFAVEARITAQVGLKVESRQIFRLRILQKGPQIQQRTTLCAFKLPDVQGVATLTIPPLLQQLLWKKNVDATGEFIQNGGSTYTPPESLLLVGAKLADPAKDPLPTLKDPSSAFDDDGDGHPGVTLGAKLVTCTDFQDLYVALRTGAALSGKVLSADLIQGTADVKLDESVVGISDPCLQTATTIKILVLPGSPFQAKRVGDAQDLDRNGNVSCAELAIQATDLFGDFWAH